MKLEPFNLSQAKWDEYRAFHYRPAWNIVQFDTNELIVTTAGFDPAQRRLYENLNVGIYATTDEKCPSLYESPDAAKPVPKAWLTCEGGQQILVDYCTGRAVRLRWIEDRIPVRLRRHLASCYFAGPGEPPIGGKITLRPPATWTEQDEQHFTDVIAACQMWAGLHEYPKPPSMYQAPKVGTVRVPWEPSAKNVVHEVSFEMLTDVRKVQIAWHGLSNHRARREVEYLYVKT